MRSPLVLRLVIVASFLCAFTPFVGRAESPAVFWLVNSEKIKLPEDLQKGGVISDQKAFRKLLDSVELGRNSPEIDWERNFVALTTTYGGHIGVDFRISKDKDADLVAGPRTKGGGNTLVIAVVPRSGVETFRGQPLPKVVARVPQPFFDPTDKTELVDPPGPSQIRIPKQPAQEPVQAPATPPKK